MRRYPYKVRCGRDFTHLSDEQYLLQADVQRGVCAPG